MTKRRDPAPFPESSDPVAGSRTLLVFLSTPSSPCSRTSIQAAGAGNHWTVGGAPCASALVSHDRFPCNRRMTPGGTVAANHRDDRGDPAVLGMTPLDRKLCVPAFRRVCPWNDFIIPQRALRVKPFGRFQQTVEMTTGVELGRTSVYVVHRRHYGRRLAGSCASRTSGRTKPASRVIAGPQPAARIRRPTLPSVSRLPC